MGSFAQMLSEALAAPAETVVATPFSNTVRAFEATLTGPSADRNASPRVYPGTSADSLRPRYGAPTGRRSSVAWSA